MANRVPPSADDDAKLARELQEQEQQLANDSLVAALLQEEMHKASQRHNSSGRSSHNARSGVRRPRSSSDIGSLPARENQDEALARVLQAEEEEKMAEQQRQNVHTDSARANGGPSNLWHSFLGLARRAYDDSMSLVHSGRHSDGSRRDDDDDDDGGFRGERSGRRALTRPSFPPLELPHFSRPQGSGIYENLRRLGEMLGDVRSAGLSHHTIDSLPVTQYQQPTSTLTPRPAAAAAQSAGDSEENSKCSICLEQFERAQPLRTLPCLHRFHKNCIDEWLQEKGVCPVCRIDVKSAMTTRR